MSQNPTQGTPEGTPWNEPAQASDPGQRHQQPVHSDDQARTPEHPDREAAPREAEPRREQPADLDPALDGRAKSGISGATWIALIVGLVILILLLVFILQNMNDVLISYMAWEFTLPLGVAMLLAAIAGALIMAMVGSIRLIVLTRRVHKLEKERETIKRTLR